MIVVFYSLGSGCFFFLILLLFMLANISEQFCTEVMAYLVDNTIPILVIIGVISLLIAILAGYMTKKPKWTPAVFLLISHFLCCTMYGVYGVVKASDDSFFLLLFGGAVYLAIVVLHAIIAGWLAIVCIERNWTWPIYPVCILITLFLYNFY